MQLLQFCGGGLGSLSQKKEGFVSLGLQLFHFSKQICPPNAQFERHAAAGCSRQRIINVKNPYGISCNSLL